MSAMADWLGQKLARLEGWAGYSTNAPVAAVRAKLDANENHLVPLEEIRRLTVEAAEEIDARRYPEDALGEMGRALGRHLGLPPGCIVPCSGADQAIDLLCQSFLERGERVVAVGPTFSVYRVRAALAGARYEEVPMGDDLSLPVDRVLEGGRDGIAFVCSPNNPTGNQFRREEVAALLDSFEGLVVLDEAYVDFADWSLVKMVRERDNLAVLRTFSKAFGIAGLRLGYMAASEGWAGKFLEKVQYPYPLNSVSVAVARRLLEEYATVQRWTEAVRRERAWLAGELRKAGAGVLDSKANFLLADLPADYQRCHERLMEMGVLTRKIGPVLRMRNCLRVTVGDREMNECLLRSLEEVLRDA